jgi:hypothetical protein
MKYDRKTEQVQGKAVSQEIATRLEDYLSSLLISLSELVDKRLVKTFLGLVGVIISFRGYRHGLLLSELGGYLMPPGQAPAGTKRLSNLLHGKWSYNLWQEAKTRLDQLEQLKESFR